ncbi:MAG: substrate-binding domain-containing protein [Elusimicrobiota bacterium]
MSNKKTVELIMPPEGFLFSSFASNHYFTEILRGVLAVSNLFSWDITINHNILRKGQRDYKIACDEEVTKGLLLVAPILSEKNIEEINGLSVPAIVVNARYPQVNYVDTNNIEGAKKAVEYLIKKGHSKIAAINGLMETTNAVDRFEGYKQALAENHFELDEGLVRYGTFYEDSGYKEMNDILEPEDEGLDARKDFTAVFCGNDLMAFGVIRALNEHKLRVPENVSVIGFNDHIISSYYSPPLTTVRQQLFHLGKEAMTTMINLIEKKVSGLQHLEMETRLIERDSVLPCGT